MASQDEIETMRRSAWSEQEDAKREFRTPNVPYLDEIGFEVIEQNAIVICDSPSAATFLKDEDGEFDFIGYGPEPDPIVGKFVGFEILNMVPPEYTIDTVPSDLVEKAVSFTMVDSYNDSILKMCPLGASTLLDPSSCEEGRDPRLRQLLGIMTGETVSLDELQDFERTIGNNGLSTRYLNALLNAFVRPHDLFDTVRFGSYITAMYNGNELSCSNTVTVRMHDDFRFRLMSQNEAINGIVLSKHDDGYDARRDTPELLICRSNQEFQYLPVAAIMGFVAKNRLRLPSPYRDLRRRGSL